jgi:Ca2+-binding RTX toxin-like protein
MPISASEQYLLELINRARLDPLAEAERYGVGLNDGLADGQIGDAPLQVLAHSSSLSVAADSHSTWMLETNTFAHEGEDGSSAGARIADSGYKFAGAWTWAENLAWTGTTGDISLEAAISQHHKGLYLSSGHRANTFSTNVREIGLGQVEGSYTLNGVTYNSSMLTENFALSGNDVFITGVAYSDKDRDDFYSIGEGLSGVTFKTNGSNDSSASAGGYAIDTTDNSSVISIVRDGNTLSKLSIDTSDGNVKLDLIAENGGGFSLAVSANTTLNSGISDARLLGAGDLNLKGHSGDNFLMGNSGKNKLVGGNGDDTLKGYASRDKLIGGKGDDKLIGGNGADKFKGNAGDDVLHGNGGKDKLIGGNGDDLLKGGSGNDVLKGGSGKDIFYGGSGADKFVFNRGKDVIRDFNDDVDTIVISRAIISGSGRTIDDLLDSVEIINGNAVFDLYGSNQLTVHGITDIEDLRNDLFIG